MDHDDDGLAALSARFVGALSDADEAGVRGCLAEGAATRGFDQLIGDVRRRGTRFASSGERWVVVDRAAVGLDAVTARGRRRLRLLAVEEGGEWRLAGVVDARALVWAYLVRWIDAGTRLDELPASVAGAAWGTALAAAWLGGGRPATLLGADRVDAASDEARAQATALMDEAATAAGRGALQVAVLGARGLPATGQIAVGLAVIGEERQAQVWLTLAPGAAGERWRLLGASAWPSLTALIEGEALERSVAAAMGRSAAPGPERGGVDRLASALSAARRAASQETGPDPAVTRLLGRLRAALERYDAAAGEGDPLAAVAEVLRDAVGPARPGDEPLSVDVGWLDANGPALVARVLAALAGAKA